VEYIEVITDHSDFNFPRVRWKVDEESGSVMPLNVKTDLESDIIGGLFRSAQANDNGIFLDLVFTSSPVDVSVACPGQN
jgi:hypothetical protein